MLGINRKNENYCTHPIQKSTYFIILVATVICNIKHLVSYQRSNLSDVLLIQLPLVGELCVYSQFEHHPSILFYH